MTMHIYDIYRLAVEKKLGHRQRFNLLQALSVQAPQFFTQLHQKPAENVLPNKRLIIGCLRSPEVVLP